MIQTRWSQLRLRWRLLFFLFFVNGIFFVLYHKFLIGNGVYLYDDIGSDAYTSSYPIISMISRLFRSGQFPQYELHAGMGSNIAVTYLQYLNPIKGLLLLFGNELLPVGILLYLLIQTNVTALAGFFFFRAYTGDDTAAFIPAMIWTYTGYTVLWTQNLSFGVCISMFTLVMLALRFDLERQTLRTWLSLTGLLALFLFTNYYYYYMTGIFSILFVIGFACLHQTGLRRLLRHLIRLFLAGVCSLLIGACDVAAIVSVFFGSTRAAETASRSGAPLFQSSRVILTGIGRLLSTNFYGIGDQYTADSNYYESACLFASMLFLIALCYLLLAKQTRRRTLLLLVLTTAALSVTLTGTLLNFSSHSQRYVFFAVFLELMAIADFIHALTVDCQRRLLTEAVLLSMMLIGALMLLLLKLSPLYGYTVNQRALLLSLGAFGLYAVILIAAAYGSFLRRTIPVLLVLAVSLELLISNYDSVNRRSYITTNLYQYSFYNDGTQLAVSEIAALDSDLYRISGDSDIANANGGMVNDYYASSAYSSTLPKSLIALTRDQNTYEESRNHFLSDYYSYLQFTLLGGRYLIEDGFHQISEGMEPSLMTQIDRIFQPEHGIDKRLFRNNYALPFGYLYTNEVSRTDFDALNASERMHLLTSAFYETDGKEGISVTPASDHLHQDTVTPLLPTITEANELSAVNEGSGVLLTPTAEGAHFFCSTDPAEGEPVLQTLHLALSEAAKETEVKLTIYPLTVKEPLAKESYIRRITLNADYPEVNLMLPDELIGLRIDLNSGPASLSAFELLTCPGIQDELQVLAQTDISGIRFEDSTYHAAVRSKDGGMLAVPLVYSKEWTAEVNGVSVPVHNINGGLVGIPLSGGTEQITIRYEITGFRTGLALSTIGVLLYMLLWMFSGRIEQRTRHQHGNTGRSL